MTEAVSLKTTLEVRDACLCLAAQRAARVLARRFDRAFRPVELKNGQFSLLMALNGKKAASMGGIARLLGMDRTTLTAALKPLIRRKLVKVVTLAEDRRARFLSLTPSGRRLLVRAVPIWRAHHRAVEKELRLSPRALRAALTALAGPSIRGAASRD